MYRFTADGQHLGKGITWRKGQAVPPGMPIEDMLKSGAIVMEVAPETQAEYTDMTHKELGELMERRGLEYARSKEDRIDRLLEDDKGGVND